MTFTTNKMKAWSICIMGAFFFFYQFMQLSLVDTLSSDLLASFSISPSRLADISSMYLLGIVIFYLPAGYLFDRFSIRWLLLSALSISLLSTALFATSNTIWLMQLARFINGGTHCFAFLGCMRLASLWLPDRLGFAVGMNFTIGFLGGVFSHTPMMYWVEMFGWRSAMLINVAIGIGILFLSILILRDHPDKKASHDQPKIRISQVLWHRQNWFCALFNMMLNLPIMLLAALWGTVYLIQQEQLTATQASTVMAMIFNGAIIGSPIAGWLSEHFKTRKRLMMMGALLAFSTTLLIFYLPHSTYLILLCLYFVLGLSSGVQAITYTSITESNETVHISLALSITSIIILGGGGIAQKLFGELLDTNWIFTFFTLSFNQYDMAFLVLSLSFLFALLFASCVRETYINR